MCGHLRAAGLPAALDSLLYYSNVKAYRRAGGSDPSFFTRSVRTGGMSDHTPSTEKAAHGGRRGDTSGTTGATRSRISASSFRTQIVTQRGWATPSISSSRRAGSWNTMVGTGSLNTLPRTRSVQISFAHTTPGHRHVRSSEGNAPQTGHTSRSLSYSRSKRSTGTKSNASNSGRLVRPSCSHPYANTMSAS